VIGPISAALRAGTSARVRIDAALSTIAQRDSGPDGLHAFLSLDADGARARADAIDSQTAAGPLAGAPLAIKDNLCTLGLPTTCGSRILDGYQSPFEATAVRRLRAAGAIIVGKTNLDEFAMGSSTENSAFGPTRNPHDPARVPGGSSGGSCAAVAAGMAAGALGSETGGSVRQPAAFCGIVGIKPSYGRVSRYGLVAFASSLDHVGVIGRTVEDAARLLQVIAGADPLDATCADRPVPDLVAPCAEDVAGLVVGVPDEYFPPELDRSVAWLCNEALERLRDAGAQVRRVSLPHTSYAIPTYYLLAPAEASSNLARYDGVRYGLRAGHGESTREVYEATRSAGFGAEVKRRIMLGTFALSAGYHDAYYGRAQRVRRLITQDFERVFADGVDILFTPTTPGPAFAIGERVDDPYAMYLSDVFTVTANLASLPAISIPIGEVEGLPVGGQFLARRWDESTMIRAAAALERALAT
jgi:aspartyl-tRNA(Asn)/glutamyl-tRNA(Gln) amidotransferase subunit A